MVPFHNHNCKFEEAIGQWTAKLREAVQFTELPNLNKIK